MSPSRTFPGGWRITCSGCPCPFCSSGTSRWWWFDPTGTNPSCIAGSRCTGSGCQPGGCAKIVGRLTSYRYTASVNFFGASYTLSRKVAELHDSRKIASVQYPHLGGMGVFRPRRIPSVVRLSSYLPLWRIHGEYDHTPPAVLRQQERWERYGLKRADAVFGPCGEVAAAVEGTSEGR